MLLCYLNQLNFTILYEEFNIKCARAIEWTNRRIGFLTSNRHTHNQTTRAHLRIIKKLMEGLKTMLILVILSMM